MTKQELDLLQVPTILAAELGAGPAPEVVARLVRIASGNRRLLTRLLTQIERVVSVNDAEAVSLEIVEAARDSLVMGRA